MQSPPPPLAEVQWVGGLRGQMRMLARAQIPAPSAHPGTLVQALVLRRVAIFLAQHLQVDPQNGDATVACRDLVLFAQRNLRDCLPDHTLRKQARDFLSASDTCPANVVRDWLRVAGIDIDRTAWERQLAWVLDACAARARASAVLAPLGRRREPEPPPAPLAPSLPIDCPLAPASSSESWVPRLHGAAQERYDHPPREYSPSSEHCSSSNNSAMRTCRR